MTEISQNIMTDIISVTKNSVMEEVFPSQNCDGVLSLFHHNFVTVCIIVTNPSQNCDGFVTVICHNFVTKIVFVTKFSS